MPVSFLLWYDESEITENSQAREKNKKTNNNNNE